MMIIIIASLGHPVNTKKHKHSIML